MYVVIKKESSDYNFYFKQKMKKNHQFQNSVKKFCF